MFDVVGFDDFFKRGNAFYWEMLSIQNGLPIPLPLDLFGNGEQGVWYDPDDLSTLYQDVTGSIPVTAVGQPVGLMLDKKFGLIRGAELIINGNFESLGNWSLSASVQISSSKLRFSSSPSNSSAVQLGIVEAGKDYEISYTVDSLTSGAINIKMQGSGGFTGPIVTAAGSYKTILTAGADGSVAIVAAFANTTAVIDNISVRALPGSHAGMVLPANKPTLQQNSTTGAYYLSVDADDWMSTPPINFSATDKVTVFAATRKLTDTVGLLVELSSSSTTNNGTFAVVTGGVIDKYSFLSKGTLLSTCLITGIDYNAPLSSVLYAVGDIAADTSSVSVNNSITATSALNQGTGNYGNYPLYLFKRGGIDLLFTGHFYGMIIVGRLCTGSEQSSVKSILAGKIGV